MRFFKRSQRREFCILHNECDRVLLQDTQELFESELKKKKEGYEFNPAWSSEFSKYFDKNIMPDIGNLSIENSN